jgi:hypothetical protein
MMHIIFIYMLLSPRQTGETWEPAKSHAVLEVREQWIEK